MATTLSDIERLGEAKMDAVARSYISIGAGQGQTLRKNTEAFKGFANVQAAFQNSTCSTDTNYSEYSPCMDAKCAATLKDLEWLCSLSDLPVVVKGVLTAEAALAVYRHGAAAVMVSNHGGRQLDGTPATMDALPEVVAAVGHRMEVYLDGGVRCGADLAKALSLGARAVFLGRPVLWGLAYDGKEGVSKVLNILKEELDLTIRLLGCRDIKDLSEDFVVHEEHYSRPQSVSWQKTWTNGC